MPPNFCSKTAQVHAESFCSSKKLGKSYMAGDHNLTKKKSSERCFVQILFSRNTVVQEASEETEEKAISGICHCYGYSKIDRI